MKSVESPVVLAKPTIIFDGVCVLCNGAVNFIIRRDPNARYQFTPMQSEVGQQLIRQLNAPQDDGDTMLLVENGVIKVRTDAALSIAKNLKWPWPGFAILGVLPTGFRDYFYRLLAKHRYGLFGKRKSCMVPSAAQRARFID